MRSGNSRRGSNHRQNRAAARKRRAAFVGLEGLEGRSLFSGTLGYESTLVPSTPAVDQQFGAAVAAKGNLALVGGMGVVALYDMSTNTKLWESAAPNGEASFGGAVTFFGQDQDFAVSAPNEEGGKVYLYDFQYDAGGFSADPVMFDVLDAQQYGVYVPSNIQTTASGFGTALAAYQGKLLVATQADITTNTVMFGEELDGTVRLIEPSTGVVIDTYVSPSANFHDYRDNFGKSLAVDGNRIVVGATRNTFIEHQEEQPDGTIRKWKELVPGPNVVYVLDNGVVSREIADLTPGADPNYWFGQTVAVSGDNVFIGAPVGAMDENSNQLGAPVYQYNMVSGAVTEYHAPATATPWPGGGNYVGWGYGLTVNGDQLMVGAPLVMDPSAFDYAGQVYLFDTDTQEQLARFSAPNYGGIFGFRTAAGGDNRWVVGDATVTLNQDYFGAGAAYVIKYTTGDGGGETEATPPTASAGGPLTVLIDQQVTLSAAGSVAGTNEIATYEWDLDNDGQFDDATGAEVSHVFTALGTFTVSVRVSDAQGNFDVDSATVTVELPAGPTTEAGADQSVLRDSTVFVSATASGATVLSYAWDFNGDGMVDSTAANASFVYTATGTYVVTLVVSDTYGQTATDSLTVTVTLPAAPTVDAGVAQSVETGDVVAFAGTATAGAGASIASVQWDFNYDGVSFAADASGLTPTFAYAVAGNYVVAMRVTDNFGQVATDFTLVTVTEPAVPAGPVAMDASGNLVVTAPAGSTGTFQFRRNADGSVGVSGGGTNYGSFSPTGAIVIHGSDAGNLILVSDAVTTPVYFFGGAGTDVVQGGGGADILVGGGGLDLLTGGSGRDLLIGGTGTDVVLGSAEDDILIAGTTAFDNDPAALAAILAEWNSGRSYTQRVNNLRNASPTADRANGSVFLIADSTVFNDDSMDVLTGNGGQDWYLFNNDSGVRDVVAGRQINEILTDLDLVVE